MKTIQQRQEYHMLKLKQLDQVKDASKHTKRLARIMKHHQLLTELEVKQMRENLHKVFGELNNK